MAKLVYCTEGVFKYEDFSHSLPYHTEEEWLSWCIVLKGVFKYEDVSHSLPYHTEEEWLSWCIVLKGFLSMKMLAIVYHTILKKNG